MRPRSVPLPPEPIPDKKGSLIIHIALFLCTCFTTTLAGANRGDTLTEYLLSGVPYSFTIMSILLSHEMGHYFAARRFGVKSTLPYFIPIYIPEVIHFGTMGAVIKTRSSIPSRRALLYIGAMGPLMGFIPSIAAVIIGIYLSEIKPVPVPQPDMVIPIFGDSLLFKGIVLLIHGPLPAGHDIYLSPYAWAGWIGFLITSLNLMPLGQLDGSHILYALLGKNQRVFGWGAFITLIGMAFFVWQGWAIWIILTLVLLMVAHPSVPDMDPLSPRDRIIGWSCMAILALTFIPVPVSFISAHP